MMKLKFKSLITILFLGLSFLSNAKDVKLDIYTNWRGQAIRGYDVVAYFTDNNPTKGNSNFKYNYGGVTWLFSSQKNLNLFKKNPNNYIPQYGGYCAWAVGKKNSKASIDPNQWTIVNNKLYLNYNKLIQNKWLKDRDNLIKSANKNWPNLKK